MSMSIFDNTDDNLTALGKTRRSTKNDSIYLTIPNQFAKELDIENSKVSMSLLYDY